jgi:DNA-binding SARP family transcriptional activator/transcriptional regulator with XRE-family HTH domain
MGDSGLDSRFGTLVRAYRLEAGLTQQELAAKAGLSVAALRDFEQSRRRRPRPSSLAALVCALGLDTDQAASLARAAKVPRHDDDAAATPRRWTGPAPAESPLRSGQGLWLAALGPLEAWCDGTPVSLGPPARRAVLGLLVMNPGALMRRETIVDVLWGEAPPRTAASLVQAHVSRLRRVLEPLTDPAGGGGAINSVRGAYTLRLSDNELDVLVFRDLAARAAAAGANGDYDTACDLYQHAIGLWRGDPLADVDLLHGHPGITLLRQQLVDVLLRYADVVGALGQHHRVLGRLQALAAAEPLNESAHARLMIALAGSGRQAAAIRVYEDLRLRLNRELAVYPGGELAEAHMRVLRQDIRGETRGCASTREPGTDSPAEPCLVGRGIGAMGASRARSTLNQYHQN